MIFSMTNKRYCSSLRKWPLKESPKHEGLIITICFDEKSNQFGQSGLLHSLITFNHFQEDFANETTSCDTVKKVDKNKTWH